MPLFSVIVPAYNRADLIRATLDSVLAQEFTDYEIVVADDGSKDNTAAVVQEYVQRHPDKVKLHVQQNRGEGAARNLGIRNATGEYIAYLDSDDVYFPWTLQRMARVVQENDHPAIVVGTCYPFKQMPDLQVVQPTPTDARALPDMLSLMRGGPQTLPTTGSIVRRDLAEAAGLFQELHINQTDVDLWLRLGTSKGFVRLESPPMAGRREHGSNISGNRDMTIAGANNLINREKSGAYPGGKQRQRERLEYMLFHIRWITLDCLRAGRFRGAWGLYASCFKWHLKLGRFRYLLGFPAIAIMTWFKPRPAKH